MVSDAKKRANKKYSDAHIDQIRFDAPRGFRDRVQQAAQAAGVSPSRWMREIISAALERAEVDRDQQD